MALGLLKRLFRGQSLGGRPSPPKANFSANYEKYCGLMDKEDDLINNRVNWLLASQSILFAALAIGQGALDEPLGETIIKVVTVLGLSSSLVIWVSVMGAVRSFCRYRYLLLQVCPKAEDTDHEYPQLHRSQSNIILGFISPVAIPLLIAGAWLWLLIQARSIN